MNLVNKLLLVTFVFAITQHDVTSTNQELEDPVRTVESIKFEKDARLSCSVTDTNSNLTTISWYRNDQDLCTKASHWCSSKDEIIKKSERYFVTTSTLTLPRVIQNATYTCLATTYDGGNWTVSKTEVVVAPNRESSTDLAYGRTHRIDCIVGKYSLHVRLVRDGNESCTPNATWCSEEETTFGGSSKSFDVLDLQAKHTFKCEVFIGVEYIATVSVHDIQVYPAPKIHDITLLSPVTGTLAKGGQVIVSARFYSATGKVGLSCRWDVNNGHVVMVARSDEDQLSILSENEYECKVSVGPINYSSNVTLEVKNIHVVGEDKMSIPVNVDLKNAVTIYASYGSDNFIECDKLPNTKMRLLRDGDDNYFIPGNWYSLEREKKYSWGITSDVFRVINLTANHIYTCEMYSEDEKNVTKTMIQRIHIVPQPKILRIELSPPGPTYPRMTQRIVATARFQWYTNAPAGEPGRRWRTNVQSKEWPYEEVNIKDELRFISGNEYESKVVIGPVAIKGDISLEVSSAFGKDKKTIHVVATAQYKEECQYGRVLCQPNTTKCEYNNYCYCLDGLFWDESTCRKAVDFGQPCETSGQCQRKTGESICNPERKRCSCPPGYGREDFFSSSGWGSCQKYPFQKKDMHVEFGGDVNRILDCTVHISNFSEVMWIRNGKDICTNSSTWCSQEETRSRADQDLYYSRLSLWKVTSTGTYTCQAITSDGRNVTICKNNVIVDPIAKETTYSSPGSDSTIHCPDKTTAFDIRLVRDGRETCTLGDTWCAQRNTSSTTSSSRYFDVLNLQSNHTYKCESYSGNDKLATAAIYHIQVGVGPKIRDLTLSPAGSQPKGTFVVATARLHSKTSEKLFRRWTIYNGIQFKDLEDQLSNLFQNEYHSTVSFGPLDRASILQFEVSNGYGYDMRNISVGVPHGEICNSAVMCATENDECDRQTNSCQCRPGYVWNSSICLKKRKFGEPCDSMARCETDNTECDMKARLCLCRTEYHWEETSCQKNV